MDKRDEGEFYEDFGARALTEAQLDALLAHARETNSAHLRQLVSHFRFLRSAAEALLQRVETSEAFEAFNQGAEVSLLRWAVRGDAKPRSTE